MSKKRDYDLFIVKFHRNDCGWRFTLWERVDYTTNENWFLFYLCRRNGTSSLKRGFIWDVCNGSASGRPRRDLT